ncbi:ATP-binding cassette sub-family G member 5-like [Paramacrobiotus metropolitanus]|uniref:ATP-binding cassette sub-family G member 5-like n=1 Tax=Paramacrobiotus metropolitanus TaxID=2943436 RepID=UPI002446106C|nr:ATP-binding cassette sub-family G member 5-like [Paramacrobiotus metropolitanus]
MQSVDESPQLVIMDASGEVKTTGISTGNHFLPYTSALTSSLELVDVEHIGEITKGTLFQKLTGNVPSGPVLKDVSLEVYGGELMGILGSSGSGKRALVDVMSRRALGITRGIILLNQMPLTAKIFRDICAVVTLKNDLIPGLTVWQTINFAAGLTISSLMNCFQREIRVNQVARDLGLDNPILLKKEVSKLSLSEKRRLLIAMELVRDPLLVLIDEPTRDLDPLEAYLVCSILASYAKKYNRMVVITLEKPRSDIVPLLDRVTILSLGDVVYTGYTRTIADYFKQIGFPCPELENPLMHYLCLATVDRRSKEKFTETNSHIEILVQKYKVEGEPFKRYAPATGLEAIAQPPVLAALAKPIAVGSLETLLRRKFTLLFQFLIIPKEFTAWQTVIWRLLAFPFLCFFIWLFYFHVQNQSQYSFPTRNGLIFTVLTLVTFLSACVTAFTYEPFRTRYFQETRNGCYNGILFIVSEIIHSFVVNSVTVFAGAAIIFYACGLRDDDDGVKFVLFALVLFCCWNFVELSMNCLMLWIKQPLEALSICLFIVIFYLVCSSGTVKSLYNLDDWLYVLTYGMIYRYAGSVINYNEFFVPIVNGTTQPDLLGRNSTPCGFLVDSESHCRYQNSTDFLAQRYTRPGQPTALVNDVYRDFGICWVFYVGMILITIFAYSIPLPSFVKRKFRD